MNNIKILIFLAIAIFYSCNHHDCNHIDEYEMLKNKLNSEIFMTSNEFCEFRNFQNYLISNSRINFLLSLQVSGLILSDTQRKLIHEKKLEYDVWNYEQYKNSSYFFLQNKFEEKLGVKIYEGFQFDWDEDYSDYSTITQYYLPNSDECFIYEIQIGLPTSKIDNKESILFHEFEYLVLKYDLQYFKQDLKKTVEYFKKDTTYSEIESEKFLEAIEKYSNCRK